MIRTLFVLAAAVGLVAPAAAQKITVTGGAVDETNVVVTARLPDGAASANTVTLPDGTHIPA